jgi:glutathione peroxidase-family protein
MNSYFIQREGGSLYEIKKASQQEYGVEFVLNGSKSSITNPMRTFLASLAKSASKLLSFCDSWMSVP